jgi:hypothetical protein
VTKRGITPEWSEKHIELMEEWAAAYGDEDFVEMHVIYGRILEHIRALEPERVPGIVGRAWLDWIKEETGDSINRQSPALRKLTNLVGTFTPREDEDNEVES